MDVQLGNLWRVDLVIRLPSMYQSFCIHMIERLRPFFRSASLAITNLNGRHMRENQDVQSSLLTRRIGVTHTIAEGNMQHLDMQMDSLRIQQRMPHQMSVPMDASTPCFGIQPLCDQNMLNRFSTTATVAKSFQLNCKKSKVDEYHTRESNAYSPQRLRIRKMNRVKRHCRNP